MMIVIVNMFSHQHIIYNNAIFSEAIIIFNLRCYYL